MITSATELGDAYHSIRDTPYVRVVMTRLDENVKVVPPTWSLSMVHMYNALQFLDDFLVFFAWASRPYHDVRDLQ